jgi:anti-sigma factor RsiW
MEEQAGKRFENCREIFAELSAYLDAELPPEACREIEEHLSGCEPCVEFVNSLRRTVELCRQYEAGALPEPLSQRAKRDLLAAFQKMLAARRGQSTPPTDS